MTKQHRQNHPHQDHHVSKELEGVYHKLSNVEHTMQEWHDLGHHPTKSELIKAQNAISEADGIYSQGQFVVNGHAPEGQAIVASLLEKAHHRLREFEIEIED